MLVQLLISFSTMMSNNSEQKKINQYGDVAIFSILKTSTQSINSRYIV